MSGYHCFSIYAYVSDCASQFVHSPEVVVVRFHHYTILVKLKDSLLLRCNSVAKSLQTGVRVKFTLVVFSAGLI